MTPQDVFENIELVSVIIFTAEYAIRLACQPCRVKSIVNFVTDMQNIVDLLACLPFWVTKIIALTRDNQDSSGGGLGFVRVIRLVRVFRVLKFGKNSSGIQMFTGAITRSFQPLSILLFSMSLAVVILSSIMYMAEADVANVNASGYSPQLLHDASFFPETHVFCFGTIPRCFWWAVVTMTTVGYGDCYPVTVLGKTIAIITMLSGVLILALPITVVGANFQKMVEIYQDDRLA